VSQALERIRKVARERKKERFTALFHHISTDLLEQAFDELKTDAAPGVDRLTWTDYEADLEDNLEDLHDRVQRGAYRALPSRRVYTTGGGHTAERDLRGGLPRVLVRVPAGTRRA
jgi:retron-type reverse transcriptase